MMMKKKKIKKYNICCEFSSIFLTFFSMFFDMQDRSNNRLKMVPCGCPGDPWGLPGTFQGTVRARFPAKLAIHMKNWPFCNVPGMSRAAPGNPADPQNSTKIWIVAKKDRSKHVFLWIFVHKHGFLAFCKIFHRFSTRKQSKINEKKRCMFYCGACFFNMATLTKHCIL